MTNAIGIVSPLFAIGLLGYLATRAGWFSDRAAEGLALFVFNFALPIMMVRTLAAASLPERLPWDLLGSYYLPLLLVYSAALLFGARLPGFDFRARVMLGLSSTFGNLALLGLPITILAFGPGAAVPVFIILSMHALTCFTLTTVLMELHEHAQRSPAALAVGVLGSLLRNPFILALLLGLALNHFDLPLRGPLDRAAAAMEHAVTPCALFSLGVSLAGIRIGGALREAALPVVFKLLLLPALVAWAAVAVFHLDPDWARTAVLLAAQPTGVLSHTFAERYAAGREMTTTAVFLSTVFSTFTLTALLTWFGI